MKKYISALLSAIIIISSFTFVYAAEDITYVTGAAQSGLSDQPVALLVYSAEDYEAGNKKSFTYVYQDVTGENGEYSFAIPAKAIPEEYYITTRVLGEDINVLTNVSHDDEATINEIIYDSFDDYTGGKSDKMWLAHTPYTSYAPYEYEGGTALEIKCTGTERIAGYKFNDSENNNVYKISFKAMSNNAGFYTYILNKNCTAINGANSGNLYHGFYFNGTDIGYYDGEQKWSKTQITDNTGGWHDIQLWIDEENEKITYDIDNGAYEGYTDFTLTGFAGFAFVVNGSADTSVCIDEVKIEYANWAERRNMLDMDLYVPEYLSHSLSAQLSSENIGNIFFDNNPTIDINIKNLDTQSCVKTINVTVKNQDGTTVDSLEHELSFSPEAVSTIVYAPDSMAYGTYTVDVYDGDARIGGGKFSKVAYAEDLSDKYGVCVHYDRAWADVAESMELIRNAGLSMTRTDWTRAINSSGNFYDITETNENFKTYEDISLEMDIDMLTIARFNNSSSAIEKENGFDATESNLEKLELYFEQLARANIDTVKYFEIGNEVGYIKKADGTTGDPVDYAKILKAAYNGIKKGNPDAKVIAFAHTVKYESDRTFIRGALDYMKQQGEQTGNIEYWFDVFSVHCYHERLAPEVKDSNIENTTWLNQAETAQAILAEYEIEDKEIWTTETGYHTEDINSYSAQTEKDAAAYTVRMMALNDAYGYYDKMIFYDFVNDGTDPDYSEHHYGMTDTWKMVETPLAAKQSYVTTAFYNSMVGNAPVKSIVAGYDEKYAIALTRRVPLYECTFEKPNADITMLWCAESGTKTKSYTVEGVGANVYDMYGNIISTASAGEVVNLTVSGAPIYVEDYTEAFYVTDNNTVIKNINGLVDGVQLRAVYKSVANPDGVIIAAQYSGNTLVAIDLEEITGNEGYVDFKYNGNADSVKLMKFDSPKNQIPDCDFMILRKEGY